MALRSPITSKRKCGCCMTQIGPDLGHTACERAVQRKTGQIIPWVFFYADGNRVEQRIGNFRKSWGKACMKAGLPVKIIYKQDGRGETAIHKKGPKKGQPVIQKVKADNLLHDFRRTRVRILERAGIPRKVAMQLT